MKNKKFGKMIGGAAATILLAAILTGCQQKKAATTNESSSSEAQSSSSSEAHSHSHSHSHTAKGSDGVFEDSDVKDRALSDYYGDWQSAYPYVLDGTLDEVFTHKAEDSGEKTAAEYKEYYTTGYKTDIERIVIEGNTLTYYKNGVASTGEYAYDGYKILTYESGKRGVRYLFKLTNDAAGVPKFIQFSDHNIAPIKAEHFHIYAGDESQEALFSQLENWPTYYPADLTGAEIADEILGH